MSDPNKTGATLPEELHSEEYVKNWRINFAGPMLVSALAMGLFLLVPAFIATQSTVTRTFYIAVYLVVLAITVFPFSYVIRILLFLTVAFALGLNELLSYGILGDGVIFFYAAIVIATIMFSPRAGWIAAALTLLVFAVTGWGSLNGLIVFYSSQIGNAQGTDWLSASVTILILSAIIILGFQKLQTEIIDGQKQINIVLGKLADERNHLEERVKVRTADLQTADKNSRRRAGQFEAIAQVAHAIASIQELDTLLFRVTQLISQQFGNYHTGVFLLDEEREYAVLRAANSDGGQRMLSRGHRLRVGQTGIVGYVAGTENPRIALDTGEDVVYFNNPDLPDTHSELALPLRVAGQLIGVLDVQSVEANAFNQEDVEVLSTLADQVSIAIQNARFFRETQKLLVETQSATSNYIVDAWKVLRPTFARIGYQKSGNLVKPLEKLLEGEHIRQALENGETVAQSSNLTVPIRLRGQIIGVMNLQVPQNHTWNSDEVDIAEAVAERLSLAIETSTLLKATQHRADIERVTADIAGKLSSSTRFETILQTAAQELSRALGGSDVLVQLEPVSMKMQSDI